LKAFENQIISLCPNAPAKQDENFHKELFAKDQFERFNYLKFWKSIKRVEVYEIPAASSKRTVKEKMFQGFFNLAAA